MSAPMGSARAQHALAAIAIAACVLPSGCARPSGSASASAQAASAQDSAQDSPQPEESADPMAGMVSAVIPGGSASRSVSVKFRIEARPTVGTPVKIMLALTPAADAQINRIHGSLLPGEGLALQSDRTFDLSDVHAGTTLFQEITVVPQQTGALSLDTTLLMQTDKSSQTSTYSIPLIAADNSST